MSFQDKINRMISSNDPLDRVFLSKYIDLENKFLYIHPDDKESVKEEPSLGHVAYMGEWRIVYGVKPE